MQPIPVLPVSIPIEFKKLKAQDFLPFDYEVDEAFIEPDADGFIYDGLVAQIQPQVCNTTVVNAGVGQGKSYAIRRLIYHLFSLNYDVVLAAPFKSLVAQYARNLSMEGTEHGMPANKVCNYLDLIPGSANSLTVEDAIQRRVHVITINSLLGNPGDDAPLPSILKTQYLEGVIKKCKDEERKVVFVMDEVHDSIHNFKQQYILNLWNWRPITHKIILLSATYNEASKVVIKYLAELTESRIQLIESARVKIETKQSELYLCIWDSSGGKDSLMKFGDLINSQIEDDRNIHILSYSETLVDRLLNDERIVRVLNRTGKPINKATGPSGNPFKAEQTNVGTNFKTGVDIEDERAAYFIILPNKQLAGAEASKGIFSDGINGVIQAVARLRKPGKIFLLIPQPVSLIECKEGLIEEYDYLKPIRKVDFFSHLTADQPYLALDEQSEIIENAHKALRERVATAIDQLQRLDERNLRRNKPNLSFPSLETYVLEDGEKVPKWGYDIFGRNLSPYVVWAAGNDQFLNCRLVGIYNIGVVELEEGLILKGLSDFYHSIVGVRNPLYFMSDINFYKGFRALLFSNTVFLKKRDGSKIEIKPKREVMFEQLLLSVVRLIKKRYPEHSSEYYPEGSFNVDGRLINPLDICLEEEAYLLANITFAERWTETMGEVSPLTDAYKTLGQLREVLLNSMQIDDHEVKYFLRDGTFSAGNHISDETLRAVINAINTIREKDHALNNNAYATFKTTWPYLVIALDNAQNRRRVIKPIFSKLKKVFFDIVENNVLIDGERVKRHIFLGTKASDTSESLNFVYEPFEAWGENLAMLGTGSAWSETITYTDGSQITFQSNNWREVSATL